MAGLIASSITMIDDNEYLMEFLEARFSKERWRLHRFSTCAPAKSHLIRNRCDLVLLDIDLGQECGFDFLRAIRAERRTQLLKIIMLSADRKSEAVIESARLGAVDYVVKPFDLDDLVRRVRRQLPSNCAWLPSKNTQ